MNMPSSLFKKTKKKKILICVVIKNWIGFKKNQICFWELKKKGFFDERKIKYVFEN